MGWQLVLDLGDRRGDTGAWTQRERTCRARRQDQLFRPSSFRARRCSPRASGLDPASGDAYVGSLADGALFRLSGDADVEVFSPAGADGRNSVAGVKVDPRGRLWAAGGYEGALHVYDLASRSLIARLDIGARPSCVNDIAFGPAGEAYVTDSLISLLFRVAGEPLAIEPCVDLAEQGVPWAEGLNFNGIVLTPDRRHLVACQTNLGRLWQINLETGRVKEVILDGGPLEHCDGMALSGSTLYVAVNARNLIAVVELERGRGGRESRHDPPKRRVRVSDRDRHPRGAAARGQRPARQDGSRAAASVHGRCDWDNRGMSSINGVAEAARAPRSTSGSASGRV